MAKGDYIWGSGLPARQGDVKPTAVSANQIIKFKLTPPDMSIFAKPQIKSLWDAYAKPGDDGPGVSFVLYALIQDFTETTEQGVSVRRSKGGYVENHWGTKPSTIQASGQVGLHLSAFGITPFQTEDPGEKGSETVLTWDPTTSTFISSKSHAVQDNSQAYMDAKTQGLMNLAVNKVGSSMNSPLGSLLSNAQYNSNTRTQKDTVIKATSEDVAAAVGTNAAFRKFRMLLDLFKHNGLVFDTLPNLSIYPSVYTADNVYSENGSVKTAENSVKNMMDLLAMRKNLRIAPGNILASLPIQMYVKDTIYHGFFQNFNFSYSEDSPFIANYDFTFISRKTERCAVFFPSGTAGRKPYSLILNSAFPPSK